MAGLTIIIIDHETKVRQRRLAAALTQGFWKFSPKQVDDAKQRKLKWMKLLLAGVMVACTAISITIKYLKMKKALAIGITFLIIWITFISSFADQHLNLSASEQNKKKKEDMENLKSKEESKISEWKSRIRQSNVSTEDKRLPVTIVTGFLGSGKTTLVKKVLDNTLGIKVLVIENEIGKSGLKLEIRVRVRVMYQACETVEHFFLLSLRNYIYRASRKRRDNTNEDWLC